MSSLPNFWPNSLPPVFDEAWGWTTWAREERVTAEVAGQALRWWLSEVRKPTFDPEALLSNGKTRWGALLTPHPHGSWNVPWESDRPVTCFPLPGEAPPDPAGGRFIEWAAADMVAHGQDPWQDFPSQGLVDVSTDPHRDLAIAPVVSRSLVSLMELCVRHPSATADRLNRLRWHGQSLVSHFMGHREVVRALGEKGMDFNVREPQDRLREHSWISPITRCPTGEDLEQLLSYGADPTITDSHSTSLSVYVSRQEVYVAERKIMLAVLDRIGAISDQDRLRQLSILAAQGRPLPATVGMLPDASQESLLTVALAGWLNHHNKANALLHLMKGRPDDQPWARQTWMELAWALVVSRPLTRPDFSTTVSVSTPASHEVLGELFNSPVVIAHLKLPEAQQEAAWGEALLALVNRLESHPDAQNKVLAGAMAVGARRWELGASWANAIFTGLNSHTVVGMVARRVNRDHALRHPAWPLHRLLATEVFNDAGLKSAPSPPLRASPTGMDLETCRLVLNFYNHGYTHFPHLSDGKNTLPACQSPLSTSTVKSWLATLPAALDAYPPPEGTWVEWLNTPSGHAAEKLWVKNQPDSHAVWDRLRAAHRAEQTPSLDVPSAAVPRRSRARP